jgi:tetratricopeptide (TPR) repeat protein
VSVRFRKSIKILPGVRINLSKSGPSLSIGGGGLTLNYGKHGVRTTADLPGGLYYTKLHGDKKDESAETGQKGKRKTGEVAPVEAGISPQEAANEKLDVNFFSRLTLTGAEEELVKGLKEFTAGNPEVALEHLSKASEIADGAFLAGALALSLNKYQESVDYLEKVIPQKDKLGEHFKKYGVASEVEVPITEELSVIQEADERGLVLLLAEAYQQIGDLEKAVLAMRELLKLVPDDIVARLSLVELLMDKSGSEAQTCQEVVALVGELPNETPFHTMLLLYKARALRQLGLHDIAKKTLTDALRRKKDREGDILNALRYERGLLYETLGQAAYARKDFETVFASNPNYAEVAQKLNITGTPQIAPQEKALE